MPNQKDRTIPDTHILINFLPITKSFEFITLIDSVSVIDKDLLTLVKFHKTKILTLPEYFLHNLVQTKLFSAER